MKRNLSAKVRGAALQAIAVLPNGFIVYPICGAEGSVEDGGDDGKPSSADDDGGPENEPEKDEDGAGKRSTSRDEDPEKRRLKDENAERRVAARKASEERDEALRRLKEFEDKDKSDLEKLQSDHAELQGKFDKLAAKHSETVLEREALRLSPKLKLEWRDVDDVLSSLARNEDVSVSDDGEISGIEDALKKLAKAKPHWLKDEGKGKPNGSGNGSGSSGGNVGTGGGKGDANRTKLESKYPSLRR